MPDEMLAAYLYFKCDVPESVWDLNLVSWQRRTRRAVKLSCLPSRKKLQHFSAWDNYHSQVVKFGFESLWRGKYVHGADIFILILLVWWLHASMEDHLHCIVLGESWVLALSTRVGDFKCCVCVTAALWASTTTWLGIAIFFPVWLSRMSSGWR